MKYIASLLVLILFWSCNEEPEPTSNSPLIGTWSLVAVLNDPGDGSGTYQYVTSSKTLTFYPNLIVTSNGDICLNSIESQNGSMGTFDDVAMTFSSTACYPQGHDYPLTIVGDTLIIQYPCIEPCGAKYVKLQ